MTRSIRAKALRGVVATLVIAALIPTGSAAMSSAAPLPGPGAVPKAASQQGAVPQAPLPSNVTVVPGGPAGAQADKPYMGWSSYSMQVYAGNGGSWINEKQIKAQSDAMHAKLQPYGYNRINIDAAWNDGIDAYGRPTPSAKNFPSGFQTLIKYIHQQGQKIGIYAIPGVGQQVIDANLPVYGAPECKTGDLPVRPLQQADYWGIGYKIDFSKPCGQKYIDSIADLFASWGIDFLKFDSVTPGSGVSNLTLDARDDVKAWSSALAKHKIWLELSWALDINYADYWKQYANGWRIDWDVECYCEGVALTAWPNISRLFPKLADWWRHAGPGGWNDLDSLDVGNGQMDGMTKDERRTAATLWAVSAAPMYTGNDMTRLDQYGLDLLTNREVIAVNQAGRPAHPVATTSNRQVWYALNADNSYTVALFNLGQTDANMTATFADLGLTGSAKVRDLWANKDLGTFDGSFTANDVPIHGTRLFKVTPQKNSTIKVNDDDLRVSYDGAWQRNGNYEVPATSEPLNVTVSDSAGTSAAGAANAGTRTLEVNNDNSQIVYTGSWSRSSGRGLGDYQDDVQYSETNGDSFSYSFVGNGVDYVTETHNSQGEVDIYIDGQLKQTVNTYQADGRGSQQVVYSISDLPNGAHTIRAVKKSGQFMLVDKLNIRQESLLNPDKATFNKAAPADVSIEISRDPGELAALANGTTDLVKGTDYTVTGRTVTIKKEYLAKQAVGALALDFRFRGDYLNDVHATTANGASASFTFTGTSVDWSTALAPDQGEADVYLDGKVVRRVTLHGDARVTDRQVFTATNLKNGQHTLKIVKVSGEALRHDTITYTIK
jgi:alpha-galactosidase